MDNPLGWFAWIAVLLAALLSIAGCADNTGKTELKHPGPLQNYGQTI